MGAILEGVVLNEGESDCKHERVLYEDVPFDGQSWRCDMRGCGRHERVAYSPGDKIRFPIGALISTPNPKYGGEKFYAFRANAEGLAEPLNRNEWIRRGIGGFTIA